MGLRVRPNAPALRSRGSCELPAHVLPELCPELLPQASCVIFFVSLLKRRKKNRPQAIGVLVGCSGRKIDGFRFLVYLVVFSHLPDKLIYFPSKDTYAPVPKPQAPRQAWMVFTARRGSGRPDFYPGDIDLAEEFVREEPECT